MKAPKILLLTGCIALLAASCDPFTAVTAGGILKTSNAGADWQGANGVKDNPKASMSALSISALAFDAAKPERMFAGSYNNGVFLSEDGGDTWRRILDKFLVYDIAVNPKNSDIIYAAGIFADHGRVVMTRDGGKSWNEMFNESSTGNMVRSIALNPDNPREVIIGMNAGAVIKSSDEGLNWRLLQNYNDRVSKVRWKNGSVYALIRGSGLLRSIDGGNSFTDQTLSLNPPRNFTGQLISSTGIANFNQMAISDSSPDMMLITTNKGLYRTFNGGNSWDFIPLPLKQQAVETLGVAISPSSDNMLYASAGSTVYHSSDGGATWQTQDTATTGLINIILVHPTLPQIAYTGIYLE